MSLVDGCDLPVSTASAAARDAYVDAVERMVCAQPGVEAALARALDADPRFALAHAALARAQQALARGADARASIATAVELCAGLGERERGHVLALERVVLGDAAGALAAIRAHLAHFPRDMLVLAPCTGVFGLFGFSGVAGRDRALAAFLDEQAPAWGDHWWFRASHAFAKSEIGELGVARTWIEQSLARRPDNANGAHVRAHVDYEHGDDAMGLAWLRDWCAGYAREGTMHCHLHWHVALSALALGDTAGAWSVFETQVAPDAAWGPPLNVLTDGTSFLLRAEWAGLARPADRWAQLADFARRQYPAPGVAFADVHVALAAAMTGDADGLARLHDGARGPAADMVVALADAFAAFAQGDDRAVLARLEPIVATHERIGGSRAQRDLIDQMAAVSRSRAGIVTGEASAPRRPRAASSR